MQHAEDRQIPMTADAATPSQSPGQPGMTLAEVLSALARANSMIDGLKLQLTEANSNVDDLELQLAELKRAMLGRKSEHRIDITKPGETLFDAAGIEIERKEPATDEDEGAQDKPTTPSTRKQRKKNRDKAVNEAGLRFDKDVPVETVILPNPATSPMPNGNWFVSTSCTSWSRCLQATRSSAT